MAAEAPGAADRYAHAFEAWLALGGADLEPRAETVLRDLGLDPALLDLETVTLSGGQAARASLAAILLSRFDVLLLDEPTNDLDFDGLARLERFVAERPGGAVIVSHDRAFLERTVTRVLELDEIAHTASEYGGGWAGYRELRATAARHAEERYETYSGQRDRLTQRASRQRQWSETGVRRAKAGAGQDPDKLGRRAPGRALGEAGGEGARDREGARAARGGGEAMAALGAAAALRRGRAVGRRDRAPGRAPNCGAGASCSVRSTSSWRGASEWRWSGRTAAGRRRWSTGSPAGSPLAAGTRWIGPGVRMGVLDQARVAFDGTGALRDAFVARSGLGRQQSLSLLAKFGLEADAVARPAGSLSPGERTRASLALLMASGANWLVLDEPTNHLDLPAIEQLETALEAYDGTLLLVSHDRRLLEAVALDRTIELAAAGSLS